LNIADERQPTRENLMDVSFTFEKVVWKRSVAGAVDKGPAVDVHNDR
jgi:hypothetical protein